MASALGTSTAESFTGGVFSNTFGNSSQSLRNSTETVKVLNEVKSPLIQMSEFFAGIDSGIIKLVNIAKESLGLDKDSLQLEARIADIMKSDLALEEKENLANQLRGRNANISGANTDKDEDGKPKTKIVDVKGEGKQVLAYTRARANKIDALGDSKKNKGIADGSRNANNRAGIAGKAKTTRRISDSVAIYLPPNVQDSVGATYNDTETGMLGFAAAAALDFSGAVGAKDYESASKALTGGIAGIMTEAAKKSAAAIAEGLAGAEGAAGLVNRAFGQADNPYIEVLFQAMEVRTFTYNFTFAPRNEEETADVQAIIQLFRFHMAPELQGGQARFLTLPSEFDIHYMYMAKDGTNSENDYYNRIATCVLTNCTVDYTPGAVKSFADGAPTQITMGLTFKETETLTKDKINEGY